MFIKWVSVFKMEKGNYITRHTYVKVPTCTSKHGLKGVYFVTTEENLKNYQNPGAGVKKALYLA